MHQVIFIGIVLAVFLLCIVSGCSDSGSDRELLGTVSFIITWQTRSRLLPEAAQSVFITIDNQTRSVIYPAMGTVSTLNFTGIHLGKQVYQAQAFISLDGTGAAIGDASGTVKIMRGKIAPIDISTAMVSTIDHLTISPVIASVQVGVATPLGANAYNSDGQVVMVAPGNFTWSAENTAVAKVDSSSGLLTGVTPGSTTITVTERETQKKGMFSLTVFNLLANVPLGHYPGAITIDPISNEVYVCIANDGVVRMLSGKTNTVRATVSVGQSSIGVAMNPNTGRIYTSNLLSGAVSVIDGGIFTIIARIPVGKYPGAMVMNPTNNKVYVCNIGDSINASSVGIIDGNTNTLLEKVTVGVNPGAIALNPTTNRVYVCNTNDSTMSVLDGSSNVVLTTLPVGRHPYGIAVNPITNRIYVCSTMENGTVSVLDGNSNTLITTVTVGKSPNGIAVNPTTNRIYVCNLDDDTMSVLDGNTNTVFATVPVVSRPYTVAVNPITNRVYVCNHMSEGTVRVFQGF